MPLFSVTLAFCTVLLRLCATTCWCTSDLVIFFEYVLFSKYISCHSYSFSCFKCWTLFSGLSIMLLLTDLPAEVSPLDKPSSEPPPLAVECPVISFQNRRMWCEDARPVVRSPVCLPCTPAVREMAQWQWASCFFFFYQFAQLAQRLVGADMAWVWKYVGWITVSLVCGGGLHANTANCASKAWEDILGSHNVLIWSRGTIIFLLQPCRVPFCCIVEKVFVHVNKSQSSMCTVSPDLFHHVAMHARAYKSIFQSSMS